MVVGVPESEKLGMPPEKVLVLDVGSKVENRGEYLLCLWPLARDSPGRL